MNKEALSFARKNNESLFVETNLQRYEQLIDSMNPPSVDVVARGHGALSLRLRGKDYRSKKRILLEWLHGENKLSAIAKGFLLEIQSQQMLLSLLPAHLTVVRSPDGFDGSDDRELQRGADLMVLDKQTSEPLSLIDVTARSRSTIGSSKGKRCSGINPMLGVSVTVLSLRDIYSQYQCGGNLTDFQNHVSRFAITNGAFSPLIGLKDKEFMVQTYREELRKAILLCNKQIFRELVRQPLAVADIYERMINRNSILFSQLYTEAKRLE